MYFIAGLVVGSVIGFMFAWFLFSWLTAKRETEHYYQSSSRGERCVYGLPRESQPGVCGIGCDAGGGSSCRADGGRDSIHHAQDRER
jgi:hypothetical protein